MQQRQRARSHGRTPFQGGRSGRAQHSRGHADRHSNHRPNGRGNARGRHVRSTFNPSSYINKNPIAVEQEMYESAHTFNTFGVDQRLERTIAGAGLTTPTAIQDQIIPAILDGKDMIGLSNTGTGKTAAFLIPLIDATLRGKAKLSLILAPTRELALQIEGEVKKLAHGMDMRTIVCVGGANIRPQMHALRRGGRFVIATPGRLMDLMDRGFFEPSRVTHVVLDEADRMLDMGFVNDMRTILKNVPESRQTLLFSATMSAGITSIVNDFQKNPETVSVKKTDTAASIEQDVVMHGHHDKFETLTTLLEKPEFTRVLIFGAMKHSVEKLAKELTAHGIRSESIHGNKSHSQRQRALANFKHGAVRILVATDVAARGIHVDDISHVINYDLPTTREDYIHRIGRTGRGNKRGKALTFIPTA